MPNTRRPDFVDLRRQFRTLEPNEKPEEAALRSYTKGYPFRSESGWEEILKSPIVVVLGEPGSGKSWELEERARLHVESGKSAFFVRLDLLATQPLRSLLTPEDQSRLRRWQRSVADATFFLDSVDEAKLRGHADFRTALARLRDGIRDEALHRSRLVISSRVSEWSPEADRSDVIRLFGTQPSVERVDADSHDIRATPPEHEGVRVVVLEPLDRERVEQFVRARGIISAHEFTAALDRAHAWEFARRPLDVVELARFWAERGEIGSLTELLEVSINHQLRETVSRERHDPLPPQRAREGAETLAGATALCRRLTFRIPDDVFLPDDAPEALDVADCLAADWRPEERRALLERAIFDSASYGRIRFHHRCVGEYLTAKWLVARVNSGCPIEELESLLCETGVSTRVLRPSMAPVAAWLCSDDGVVGAAVRSWVLEAAPAIHFHLGDPSGLPVQYKRAILRRVVERFNGRKRIWIESDSESLTRLSDPNLTAEITAIIGDTSVANDLRAEMLMLARYGRLRGCLDAALAILRSPDEAADLKGYAAATIRDAGDDDARRHLAEYAESLPTLPNRLCSLFCEALYPHVIDARTLVALLRKTTEVPRSGIELPYHLESHLEDVLDPDASGALLAELLILIQTPPLAAVDGAPLEVSTQFAWVGQIIPTVLFKLLTKTTLDPSEADLAARALRLLGALQESRDLRMSTRRDRLSDLDAATARHPAVRQCCFWLLVKDWQIEHSNQPSFFSQIFGYHEILKPSPTDIEWLIADIADRPDPAERALAVRLATELWNYSGRSRQLRRRICAVVGYDPTTSTIFREVETRGRFMRIRRFYFNQIKQKVAHRWWWEQRIWAVMRRYKDLRDQLTLLRNLRRVSSGEPVRWLASLVFEITQDGHESKLTPRSWEPLRQKRGRWIARATQKGCKRFWQTFTPPLPHESTRPGSIDGRLIAGLAGIQSALEDQEIRFSELSSSEVKQLAHYAVNELNGFTPWLEDLAQCHPGPVGDVLCEAVAGEWDFDATREHVNEVLSDLVYHGPRLAQLVSATIVSLLQRGDPENYTILRYALTVLLKSETPPADELSSIAQDRMRTTLPESEHFYLWLGVLMQVNAQAALDVLEPRLVASANAEQMMTRVCSALSQTSARFAGVPSLSQPDYLAPDNLRRLIPLAYLHIRLEDDVDRNGQGAYSPNERDNAQDCRNGLLTLLAGTSTPRAKEVLYELRDKPELEPLRDWVSHLIDQITEKLCDLPPWTAADVRSFQFEHEVDPKTDRHLFKIACKRLRDIKRDVEEADISLREELREGDREDVLRRWLARKLRERARSRYTVPQEEEIDLSERPDLRIEHPATSPVSMEVKWAEGWSLRELLERLENQLVGQYLRAHDSRHGVYLVATIAQKRHWKDPVTNRDLSYEEVIDALRIRARELATSRADVDRIEVVSLDFRRPT